MLGIEHAVPAARLLTAMHVNIPHKPAFYSCLLMMNPWGSKHVEEVKNWIKVLIWKVKKKITYTLHTSTLCFFEEFLFLKVGIAQSLLFVILRVQIEQSMWICLWVAWRSPFIAFRRLDFVMNYYVWRPEFPTDPWPKGCHISLRNGVWGTRRYTVHDGLV